jgi:hypothetical protein
MKIFEHNVETGQAVERDMTVDELIQYETEQADQVARIKAEAEKVEAKAALLERLGITAEEAALLLG